MIETGIKKSDIEKSEEAAELLDSELKMRDDIRKVVVRRMSLYDEGDLAKILAFLAMFPAFATVDEVVHSIYIDELEND